jgi:hypothetical protein
MRNEFLRDVMAGSAGVLLVLALIGLPEHHTASIQDKQLQCLIGPLRRVGCGQDARLLPHYTRSPRSALSARPTP